MVRVAPSDPQCSGLCVCNYIKTILVHPNIFQHWSVEVEPVLKSLSNFERLRNARRREKKRVGECKTVMEDKELVRVSKVILSLLASCG